MGHLGIEVKDNAWAYKCIDKKLDGSCDNNIFFKSKKLNE